MVPILIPAALIGTGIGLIIGGVMFARVLYSFAERGQSVRLFHRP